MRQLTGINIRQGIELEVSIEDIFTPNEVCEGDIRVKEFFENEKKGDKHNEEFLLFVKEKQLVTYKEFVHSQSLNETLKVAIYNNYELVYNKFSKKRYQCAVIPEMIFFNTETLNFEDFCFNFMTAQAFSGNFTQVQQHHFTGIGDFEINAVAQVFPLAIAGNLTLDYFFLYYNGILTNVEKIITGSIEDDIEAQKTYLTIEDYNMVINDLNDHKMEIQKIMEK